MSRERAERSRHLLVALRQSGKAETDLQLREDTPHAYDRDRIDCGRDAGRGDGYCHCADIYHNHFTECGCSRQHEMLGQRDKAGAQRDPEHELGQQHQFDGEWFNIKRD